jgi:hypothetical protein
MTLPLTASKMASDRKLAQCVIKHKRLRNLTREVLEEEIQRAWHLKIAARPIDEAALAAVDTHWQQRHVHFDWHHRILPTLWESHPRRLDIALWCNGELCGLMVARLSDAREWVSITHIEGSPMPIHPLKRLVVPSFLLAADIFASLIAEESTTKTKPRVRVMNPLKPVIAWYQSCGYIQFIQERHYSYLTCL